ncbi:ribosome-inactivating family protein [Micromonospora sp. NBS 11-29]|uniref:ribosome-inactivating family protein n=1 Tax=Micromonospora sp. NBS 11-29 TaxID=1960879 RepID=UPI001592C1CB|nr:ribosome-inactivating family protein [Micromonospora sp. NBS 11-29]
MLRLTTPAPDGRRAYAPRRRLAALLTALAMAVGLVTVAPPRPARADFTGNYTAFDWNLDSLNYVGTPGASQQAATDYWNMLAQLHRVAGHDFLGDNVDETTQTGAQLIEIRLRLANFYRGSIYLWSNNLYVAGFYSAGTGRHYQFTTYSDVFQARVRALAPNAQFTTIGSGSYTGLSGGSQESRAGRAMGRATMVGSLYVLFTPTSYTQTRQQQAWVDIIQFVAEAARYGSILNTIYNNLRDGTGNSMGANNIELENNWGTVSSFIHQQANGDYPVGHHIQIWGQVFYFVSTLVARIGYVMINNGSR